ncbi:MAG: hypothetical protein FD180_960 [Planctomycetota bacterium]|nr:MAG: hypothetical protein FD180_960 [Planctomycetota bacterium]
MKIPREWAPLLVLLGLTLILPLIPFPETVQKRLVSVGGIVFIYMIFALGLNVVPGWTGLLDLGYVAFVMIGAYTVAILYRLPWLQFEGAWLFCLIAAGLHCAIWGVLRGAPTLRLIGDYYAIVTFAFAQILLIFVQNCGPVTNAAKGYTDFPGIRLAGHATGVGELPPDTTVEIAEGGGTLTFPRGARLIFPRGGEHWNPSPGVPLDVPADVKVWESGTFRWRNLPRGGSVTVRSAGYSYKAPGKLIEPNSKAFYYFLLIVVVVAVAALARLHNSRVGRAWLAMKSDEISAKANGISIQKYRIVAFAVSGFIGGIGGGLQAYRVEIVTPGSYDFWVSVLILACIVLGGLGSIRGVIVGTAVLVSLGELLREGIELGPGLSTFFHNNLRWLENVAWQAAGDHAMLKVPDQARYLVFGAILVLVMIFRPQGLLPPKGECEPLTEDEREKLRSAPTALFRMGKQ